MKSKQLLLMHLYLLIQFISFLKCIFLIASMLLQINSTYFSKMVLVGFQYKPVSLDLAWWLATCARTPKVPGSSPAASYVQR